jgi:hypothetical protein
MDIELLSYFLPTELLEHSKIVSVKDILLPPKRTIK